MRCIFKKKIIYLLIIFLFILVIILRPMKGKTNYELIPKTLVKENLHEELASNFSHNSNITCDYDKVIYNKSSWALITIDQSMFIGHNTIMKGGEYYPYCKPVFSTAIIVPYRERAEEFYGFLLYINTFLLQQYIHYRIYIIEQLDTLPFNRAKLLNIGAHIAMEEGFPCLIFHDVDIIPIKIANIYACTKNPRLMSTNLITSRFYYSYQRISSGVIAIRSSQFRAINGMSNKYFGWGGEDEDLYARLEARNLKLCMFEPDTGVYQMVLEHGPPFLRETRQKLLAESKIRMETDGLNSLKYIKVDTDLHDMFTHIMVDLKD